MRLSAVMGCELRSPHALQSVAFQGKPRQVKLLVGSGITRSIYSTSLSCNPTHATHRRASSHLVPARPLSHLQVNQVVFFQSQRLCRLVVTNHIPVEAEARVTLLCERAQHALSEMALVLNMFSKSSCTVNLQRLML